MKRIAVIGAGHVGPVIARLALDAGFEVGIAGSGSPEKIALMTEIVIPGADARWAADAVEGDDMVGLAIPLHNFAYLDQALVAGKLVIDAMNYWPATDGVEEIFEDRQTTSSEIVQRRLPQSTIVKSLNHIGYQDLEDARRPAGSPEHPAIGVAGDNSHAVGVREDFIYRIRFLTFQCATFTTRPPPDPGSPSS